VARHDFRFEIIKIYNEGDKKMNRTILNNWDCTTVDRDMIAKNLKMWGLKDKECMPYFMRMGFKKGVMFDGDPEAVRHLYKRYRALKLYFSFEFDVFLNAEGVDARAISGESSDILGYNADVSNN
jgi:hypothetical protein